MSPSSDIAQSDTFVIKRLASDKLKPVDVTLQLYCPKLASKSLFKLKTDCGSNVTLSLVKLIKQRKGAGTIYRLNDLSQSQPCIYKEKCYANPIITRRHMGAEWTDCTWPRRSRYCLKKKKRPVPMCHTLYKKLPNYSIYR